MAITYNLYYGAKELVLRPLSKTINQEIGPIPTNAWGQEYGYVKQARAPKTCDKSIPR